jgi:predicted TIM-barrel fold metal-dependent hydrolase
MASVIDVFAHVLTPRYLLERNARAGVKFGTQYAKYWQANPGLTDLDIRFRVMDQYPEVIQILTEAGPNIESITSPADAALCARIANDEMAELVAKYPTRFLTACASLPMSDVDAALREIDRAINDLGFRGVEMFTDINGKPLDSAEFLPLFERMEALDLPILLHPRRTNTTADYPGEERSKFLVYTNFGWPFETSLAMARLAFGGVLERYPKLKIITHHAGGMIPYFHKRVELAWDFNVERMGYRADGQTLTRSPVDYYRMFYCDTAIQGNTPALMCAYEFFGGEHMVFATDMPYDNEFGARLYRETLPAVNAMPISEESRRNILYNNTARLFRLSRYQH